MVAIPGYERVVIRQKPTADAVNTSAISAAASGFNATAQAADAAAQVSIKIREADDAATLNEMLITREREKIDFIENAKKQYEGTPDGFSAYVEKSMKKRDSETIAALPQRLKQPYKLTTSESNVRDYKSNLGWETDRRVAVVGDKIARAGAQISGLAYTYGASGKSFDDIMPQIDATMVAGSGVLAPEKLTQYDEKLRSEAAKQYLEGLSQYDPQAAQNLINSGALNSFMTPEDLAAQNKKIWDATPDLMKMEQISNSKQPLSVRNNNPGNIRGADGQFKKYETPEAGQKAMADDLRIKITGKSAAMKGKFGDNYEPTINNLIHTWAPTSENDTQAYINTVAEETGIGASERLTVADIPKLQAAMIKVEGGQSAANYFATGTAFDAMPYGEKINEVEKINKAIADDPAKAAMQYGATTPQAIVDVQATLGIKPQYARVMTNQQAIQMATQINQVQSSDEIYSAAVELTNQYGDYRYNAIADLKAKGKMKPAMEGALILAASGNPKYKEHIELLAEVGKAGDKSISAMFTANGYSTKDLNLAIAEQTQDWQLAAQNEGRDPAEIQEKIAVTASLAKAKMAKVLDGDYEKAVEFATQPEFDAYTLASSNGIFRVPNKYSADAVESSLDSAMSDTLPAMVKGSDNADYVFSGDISPFLSPDEDGYMFRTPSGEVVSDKDGKPILLTFEELLAKRKPDAKSRELPYIRNDFGPGA